MLDHRERTKRMKPHAPARVRSSDDVLRHSLKVKVGNPQVGDAPNAAMCPPHQVAA